MFWKYRRSEPAEYTKDGYFEQNVAFQSDTSNDNETKSH